MSKMKERKKIGLSFVSMEYFIRIRTLKSLELTESSEYDGAKSYKPLKVRDHIWLPLFFVNRAFMLATSREIRALCMTRAGFECYLQTDESQPVCHVPTAAVKIFGHKLKIREFRVEHLHDSESIINICLKNVTKLKLVGYDVEPTLASDLIKLCGPQLSHITITHFVLDRIADILDVDELVIKPPCVNWTHDCLFRHKTRSLRLDGFLISTIVLVNDTVAALRSRRVQPNRHVRHLAFEAYHGHVLSLPLDLADFFAVMPRLETAELSLVNMPMFCDLAAAVPVESLRSHLDVRLQVHVRCVVDPKLYLSDAHNAYTFRGRRISGARASGLVEPGRIFHELHHCQWDTCTPLLDHSRHCTVRTRIDGLDFTVEMFSPRLNARNHSTCTISLGLQPLARCSPH